MSFEMLHGSLKSPLSSFPEISVSIVTVNSLIGGSS